MNKPMEQWEYALLIADTHEELLIQINDYGKAGWKLISISEDHIHYVAYVEKQRNL